MISLKKLFLSIWILVAMPCIGFAQNPSVLQIDEMLHEARQLLVTDSEKCIELSKKILNFSKATNYVDAHDYATYFIAKSHFTQKKYDSVFKKLSLLERSARLNGNSEIICEATLLKAHAFFRVGDQTSAFKELTKARSEIENIKLENSKNIYLGLWHEMKARIAYEKLDPRDLVLKEEQSAMLYYKKINTPEIPGFTLHNKNDLLHGSYSFIANEYMALSQIDSADYYLQKAGTVQLKYRNPQREVLVSNNIAYSHYLRKNYQTAKDQYLKSLAIAEKTKNKELLLSVYDGLSICYRKFGDYKNTTKYMELYMELSDIIRRENLKAQISSMDDIMLEKESQVAKKENHLTRFQLAAGILLLVSLFTILLVYKKFRHEKTKKVELKQLLEEKMAHFPAKQVTKTAHLEKIVEMAINNDPAFYVKFQEVFPEFIMKLVQIAPKINASELKLAAYLKLDFSAKEISRHTSTSVRAVEAKKYRLRKKLGINSDQDLNVWMSKI